MILNILTISFHVSAFQSSWDWFAQAVSEQVTFTPVHWQLRWRWLTSQWADSWSDNDTDTDTDPKTDTDTDTELSSVRQHFECRT